MIVIVGYFDLIGIDIMRINQELNINNFKSFFNENIWKNIINSNDKCIFYEYWCIIESYFKCLGNGIIFPKNVIIKYNKNLIYGDESNKYRFNIIHFKDYVICVSIPVNDNIVLDKYKLIEYKNILM